MNANSSGTTDTLLFRDEVYAIVGVAFEGHRELGPGFLEAVYQEAMEREFTTRGIPFKAQHELEIQYKGQPLSRCYVCDFLCYGQIIVELKAIDRLSGREDAQILNYLKASDAPVGVLVNFGGRPKLEWRRLARTEQHSR